MPNWAFLQRQKMKPTDHAIQLYSSALQKQFGEQKDLAEAVALYRQSANLGFSAAQNNLGDCYQKGVHVPQSDAVALYWATRAAERGEPTAYLGLASILFRNAVDHETAAEALKYAALARFHLSSGGNKDIATLLQNLLVNSLPKEVCESACELARAWEPLYQEEYLQEDSPVFEQARQGVKRA
jgi:TPR repeat protein